MLEAIQWDRVKDHPAHELAWFSMWRYRLAQFAYFPQKGWFFKYKGLFISLN
jgi:hypothetical protein